MQDSQQDKKILLIFFKRWGKTYLFLSPFIMTIKTIKKIGFFLFFGVFLTGCSFLPQEDKEEVVISEIETPRTPVTFEEPETMEDPLLALVKAQKDAYNKTAELLLDIKENTEKEVSFSVILLNPKKEKITSVQSWISFSKEVLKGQKVDIKTELFSLSAPGEKGFDTKKGLVKIGIATEEGKSVEEEKIHIADITFTKTSKGFASLEFFNPGKNGKTRVMAQIEGGLQNILKKEELKPVILKGE